MVYSRHKYNRMMKNTLLDMLAGIITMAIVLPMTFAMALFTHWVSGEQDLFFLGFFAGFMVHPTHNLSKLIVRPERKREHG